MKQEVGSLILKPFTNRRYSYRKEFAPRGCKFLPLRIVSMRIRMKADLFLETKSQNRAPPPLLFIPLTFPQITQRESNIVCIYNYVNMSKRVSIVKTDFGWSEE